MSLRLTAGRSHCFGPHGPNTVVIGIQIPNGIKQFPVIFSMASSERSYFLLMFSSVR